SGRMLWSKQLHPDDVYNSACSTEPKGPTCPPSSGPDYDFGSPAILVSTTGGRDLLLAGQKSGIVWAVDPEKNGEIMWETRVAQGGINGGRPRASRSTLRPLMSWSFELQRRGSSIRGKAAG